MMAETKKPTERYIHIDVYNFPLQEWVDPKQVTLEHIITHLKLSHTSNKALGWVFHNIHTGRIMGEYGYTFMHR